jgi:hypothetical protein
MGFFDDIKNKVATKLMGDLIADLGTLPIDKLGGEISLAIRRHPGQQAHLQVKLAGNEEVHYFQIPCTSEWADQFEHVAQEMRRHTNMP